MRQVRGQKRRAGELLVSYSASFIYDRVLPPKKHRNVGPLF